MKKLKMFSIRLFCYFLYAAGFVPFFVYNIWRAFRTGIRLGRVDFENELVERKEYIQQELFRRSSHPKITEEEVLYGSNGRG